MLLILVNRRTVVLPKRVRGVSDKAKVLENSLKSGGCKARNRRNTWGISRLSNAADVTF